MLRRALPSIYAKIITILQNYFLAIEKKGGDTFHEATITLVVISDKDNAGKEKYRLTSLINLDAEIPNEY